MTTRSNIIVQGDEKLLNPRMLSSKAANLTVEQVNVIQRAAPSRAVSSKANALISTVYTGSVELFVSEWNCHCNAIYVQTVFNKAMGAGFWIKQWVSMIDGVFLMPYSLSPGNNFEPKYTNRENNDFESLGLGVTNFQNVGIYFIPADGRFDREMYFWTQVHCNDTWLHDEDRPVRWA